MKYTMVVEQTSDYKNRVIYCPETNSFKETEWGYLGLARGCTFPYGWIKESGTPPNHHLDVILVSDEHYNLGDEISIKIIGVFKRNDDDDKYVAVKYERNIEDFEQLSEKDKNMLKALYPRIDEGEGWFGAEFANSLYNNPPKQEYSK